MKPFLIMLLSLTLLQASFAQAVAKIDKRTKEFSIAANQKSDYQIFGYQFANNSTKKMICFSSHVTDVRDNYNRCPLGSYFDTDKLKPGDKIFYLAPNGLFGRFKFVAGNGSTTLFYLPRTAFVIK